MSEARVERRRRVAEKVGSQLGGCEWAYTWESKLAATLAITQLATCAAHGGIHHFAVVGEGRTVAFSDTVRTCLLGARLLPPESGD